jgi:hypothetical protein
MRKGGRGKSIRKPSRAHGRPLPSQKVRRQRPASFFVSGDKYSVKSGEGLYHRLDVENVASVN